MVETRDNLPVIIEAGIQAPSMNITESSSHKRNLTVKGTLSVSGDIDCKGNTTVTNSAYFQSELLLLGKMNVSGNFITGIPDPVDAGDAVNAKTLKNMLNIEFIHFYGSGNYLLNSGSWMPWIFGQKVYLSSPNASEYFTINQREMTIRQPGLYFLSITLCKQGAYIFDQNGPGALFGVFYGLNRNVSSFGTRSTGSSNVPSASLDAAFYVAPSEVNRTLTLQSKSGWMRVEFFSWSITRYAVV
ncbi:MAG: hypothetical protein RRZ67_04810 [Victivallaceae bacterium]